MSPDDELTCYCGETFDSVGELQQHLNEEAGIEEEED